MGKARDYQLGDRVTLVSGGREMTVCKVSIDFSTEAESIECGWFENGIQQTAPFRPNDLCRVGVAKSGIRPTITGFSVE